MQPAPTEISTKTPTSTDHLDTSNTTQHGFVPDHLRSAEPAEPSHKSPGSSAGPTSTSSAADSHNGDDATSQVHSRGLNLDDSSEHLPKASVQRISEYEKALLPRSPPRQAEGPDFRIIKKKGKRLGGPQLNQFPNGITARHHLLIKY